MLLAGGAAAAAAELRAPQPGQPFDWQLSDPADPGPAVEVLDLDLFDTSAAAVAALNARGILVVCYINVGAWEDWRPDADQFPPAAIGNHYEGWPGERWLDIRRLDLLAPLMEARLDLCRDKGFASVEPDNIDAYTNDTGFPLGAADQLAYIRWLAAEAHARGLTIALKNAPEFAVELADELDWALLEDCFAQGWCAELAPFAAAGKAVVAVEYTDNAIDRAAFCRAMARLGYVGLIKHRDLDAWAWHCR